MRIYSECIAHLSQEERSVEAPKHGLGDTGTILAPDINHRTFEFEKLVSQGQPDKERAKSAFQDTIARWTRAQRPEGLEETLSKDEVFLENDVGAVLSTIARVSHEEGKRDVRSLAVGLQEAVGNFLQRRDVCKHNLWCAAGFPCAAPRALVEALVSLFQEKELHPAVLAWGCVFIEEWAFVVENFRCFFSEKLLRSKRKPAWQEARETSGVPPCGNAESEGPVVTKTVADLLRRLLGRNFVRGARRWQRASAAARLVGVKMASGTTDLDAVCFHLETLFCRHHRSVVREEYADVLLMVAFLRVRTSKVLRNQLPTFAGGSQKVAAIFEHCRKMLSAETVDGLVELSLMWRAELIIARGRWQ